MGNICSSIKCCLDYMEYEDIEFENKGLPYHHESMYFYDVDYKISYDENIEFF